MKYRYRNIEEMKDSGVEWIGEIPKNWDIITGKHLFKNNKLKNRNKFENILSLTLNGVIDRDKNKLEGLQPNSFDGYQEFYKENLVFKLIDLKNINTSRVGYVHKEGLMSPAYIRLEKNKNINTKYYYYNYFDYYNKNIYNFLGSVGVRSALNSIDLLEMNIMKNTFYEQEKIAKFLDEKTEQFDSIISKKKALIKKLEEAKKSLISEVVTGKVKVVKTNDGYELVERKKEEMKDSGVEWLGEIPKDWDVKKLKYLLVESKSRSKDGVEEALSMSQKYGLIKSSEMSNIPNTAMSLVGNKIVYKGDLVFNKLKPHLGVFSVSNYYGIVSPDYAVYRGKIQKNIKYFEYLFKTSLYITEFKKYATGVGAGLTRLYTGDLFNIYSILPTCTEQYMIVDIINKKNYDLSEIIKKTEEQIEKIKEAKQSLISEAITGKIEVL